MHVLKMILLATIGQPYGFVFALSFILAPLLALVSRYAFQVVLRHSPRLAAKLRGQPGRVLSWFGFVDTI